MYNMRRRIQKMRQRSVCRRVPTVRHYFTTACADLADFTPKLINVESATNWNQWNTRHGGTTAQTATD